MEYRVRATGISAGGSVARAKVAGVLMGIDTVGRRNAFNPAELLLAALAACMIRGVVRAMPGAPST